jgi:hypothetical protein
LPSSPYSSCFSGTWASYWVEAPVERVPKKTKKKRMLVFFKGSKKAPIAVLRRARVTIFPRGLQSDMWYISSAIFRCEF